MVIPSSYHFRFRFATSAFHCSQVDFTCAYYSWSTLYEKKHWKTAEEQKIICRWSKQTPCVIAKTSPPSSSIGLNDFVLLTVDSLMLFTYSSLHPNTQRRLNKGFDFSITGYSNGWSITYASLITLIRQKFPRDSVGKDNWAQIHEIHPGLIPRCCFV